MRTALLLVLLFLIRPCTAQPVADPLAAGFTPQVGRQVPLDLVLQDESGHSASLGQRLAGKPAVLVLGYYGCPMLCHEVQDGLLEGLSHLDQTVGDQFRVITVSIDPTETFDLAAQKKSAYLAAYQRPIAAGGWPFLVGKAKALASLQESVGFRSAALADQIAHPAGLIVLTPEGRVASYLYGIRFPAKALQEALEAAVSPTPKPTNFQRVLLLCYQYDPATGKYSLAILRAIQLLGVFTLAGLLFSVLAWLRKERQQQAEAGP